jgi:FtsP/CotA-like multicopper oxidase with cupredoxin domain
MRYISLTLGDTILIASQGTYWYHSHFKSQYCDGLRGVLVVYDPNDPYLDELYDIDDGKIDSKK